MTTITSVAKAFFEACETGGGWEACARYCVPNATFSAQADALEKINTLQDYADWMKNLLTFIPDARYEIKSFATDDERRNVAACAVFHGTHTGDGGPCPPTGRSTVTDYAYVIQFADEKIVGVTKIWNDARAVRELGWA